MTDNVGFCRMTPGGFSERIIDFEVFSLGTLVEEIVSTLCLRHISRLSLTEIGASRRHYLL